MKYRNFSEALSIVFLSFSLALRVSLAFRGWHAGYGGEDEIRGTIAKMFLFFCDFFFIQLTLQIIRENKRLHTLHTADACLDRV